MILYRKSPQLRIKRSAAPEPPFWQAAAVAPYGARRGTPVAVDYLDLRASAAQRMDVTVAENVTAELDRSGWRSRSDAPVLIDASEFAEVVFRRGEEALVSAGAAGLPAILLVSSRGSLPDHSDADATIAIAAWPLDLALLEPLFATAHARGIEWGIAVPVMYPATTDLEALRKLTELARKYEPRFLASFAVESDPAAKQAMAASLEDDDDAWSILFHSDLDTIQVATERHIAALAESIGVADFVVPPRFEAKTNWNAAIVLTLTASRMLAMDYETELAGMLARSARVVADLDKPLTRVAESASLSIIEALDDASADILTDWIESGRSPFVESVNERWKLRRDVGV